MTGLNCFISSFSKIENIPLFPTKYAITFSCNSEVHCMTMRLFELIRMFYWKKRQRFDSIIWDNQRMLFNTIPKKWNVSFIIFIRLTLSLGAVTDMFSGFITTIWVLWISTQRIQFIIMSVSTCVEWPEISQNSTPTSNKTSQSTEANADYFEGRQLNMSCWNFYDMSEL